MLGFCTVCEEAAHIDRYGWCGDCLNAAYAMDDEQTFADDSSDNKLDEDDLDKLLDRLCG